MAEGLNFDEPHLPLTTISSTPPTPTALDTPQLSMQKEIILIQSFHSKVGYKMHYKMNYAVIGPKLRVN